MSWPSLIHFYCICYTNEYIRCFLRGQRTCQFCSKRMLITMYQIFSTWDQLYRTNWKMQNDIPREQSRIHYLVWDQSFKIILETSSTWNLFSRAVFCVHLTAETLRRSQIREVSSSVLFRAKTSVAWGWFWLEPGNNLLSPILRLFWPWFKYWFLQLSRKSETHLFRLVCAEKDNFFGCLKTKNTILWRPEILKVWKYKQNYTLSTTKVKSLKFCLANLESFYVIIFTKYTFFIGTNISIFIRYFDVKFLF